MLSIAAAFLAACKADTYSAENARNQVVYELNTRQFTPQGTFAAAAEQLPRLKELGVDIIWLMPICPIGELERKGSLGSYYAIRDYENTNPEFGTLEDFDAFVAAAHKLGMGVIIDWVANHTSPDHPWVTEKPAEWYVRDEAGKTIVEYDWTDIAKLDYNVAGMRQEMIKEMLFWIDRGIDGFRCDVAHQIPGDFWSEALGRCRERSGKPLYLLAEGENEYLGESGFDATYAWELHHLLNETAQGNAGKKEIIECVKKNNIKGVHLAFTSNHDENSWQGTEFERMGSAVEAMTVLCWTLPQTQPLIYTGQEFGYDHRFLFFEKDPMPVFEPNKYTEFYSYLTGIKHSHPALDWDADCTWLDSDENAISFTRTKGQDKVTVTVALKEPWSWNISF